MNGGYTIIGEGSFWPEESIYDTISSWDTQIKYENGLIIEYLSADLCEEMVNRHRKFYEADGTTFYGDKGWISLSRSSAEASDPALDKALNDFPKNDKGWIQSENHMHGLNFAKVIKGDLAPFDPLYEAIISDCICHMGNISVRLGKELSWDPLKGELTNVPEANDLFRRELRSPYDKIYVVLPVPRNGFFNIKFPCILFLNF